MGEKVSAKERAESLRKVYALAQKNKSEDRLTQADIEQAKKVLNYKEPKKAADYGAIKDYAELSKGGGMDMGKKEEPTQWITKKEKPTQWITKKEKPKKWITKKSRGGGMDMGKMPNTVKPEPRGNPGIVENVVGKGGDYIKDLID